MSARRRAGRKNLVYRSRLASACRVVSRVGGVRLAWSVSMVLASAVSTSLSFVRSAVRVSSGCRVETAVSAAHPGEMH